MKTKLIALLMLISVSVFSQTPEVYFLPVGVSPTLSITSTENPNSGDIIAININAVKDFTEIGSITAQIRINPLAFKFTGSFVRSTSHDQLTYTMHPNCNPTGINIGTVGDMIILGMYSVPPVTLPDNSTWITLYLKYDDTFVNYSTLDFNYPEGAIDVYPGVMITDGANNTIKPSEILTDANGNILWDSIPMKKYNPKTDDTLRWIEVKEKRGPIDYPKYFISGRVGPLTEKPAFAQGDATISGKLTYGAGTVKVPGVVVTATNYLTKQTYTSTTTSTGTYTITAPKGLYSIEAGPGLDPKSGKMFGPRVESLTWKKPTQADYDLAWQYVNRSIPIGDNLREMIFTACIGDITVEAMGNFNNLLLDRNNCNSSYGWRGYWWSTTDPSTWPKPYEAYERDNGDISHIGTYYTKIPKTGDGFYSQKIYLNLTKNVTQNLYLVCRYDLNGDAYGGKAIVNKLQCDYMIPKTTGKGANKVETYSRCKNNAIKDKTRCKTHLLK